MATANTRAEFSEDKPGNLSIVEPEKPTTNNSGLNAETLKQTATEALSQFKEKTTDVLSEQKGNLTSGLTSVAQSIRQVSDSLRETDESNKINKITSQYGSDFARQLDKFSRYIENADFEDLANDVKNYARRQPALFIGGAFTLGLLAARFLKTSHPTQFIKETIRETTGGNEKGNDGGLNAQTV
jgi:hypothetical protein